MFDCMWMQEYTLLLIYKVVDNIGYINDISDGLSRLDVTLSLAQAATERVCAGLM